MYIKKNIRNYFEIFRLSIWFLYKYMMRLSLICLFLGEKKNIKASLYIL